MEHTSKLKYPLLLRKVKLKQAIVLSQFPLR